ncbi:MAG: radical SAM protein [Candidatus Sumerlaeia bacterium]|nr:radical SAM protein [Candidatus Sumerlaeia bacterium]
MESNLAAIKEENFGRFRRDFDAQRPVCSGLPVQIWLETTTRCNLNCRICARRYSPADEGRDMPVEVFKRIEEALFPTLTHIELQGWGEPMFAENFEMFYESAQRHGVRVSFITNGTLLTRDWLERFVRDGVGLMLSVDAARDATLRDLRGIALDRIESAIRQYNAIKSAMPASRSNLHIVFVGIRRNIEELPELVERAATQWRAASLLVVHLQRAGLPADVQAEHLANFPDLADAVFIEAFELAGKLGLMLELPPLFGCRPEAETRRQAMSAEAEKQSYHYCGLGLFRSRNPRSPYPNRCPDPWLKAYVEMNGNVRPCCAYGRVFGNVVRQPFGAIWNGALYQRLRRKIHSRIPPLFCRECNIIYGITGGNPDACMARLGLWDKAVLWAQRAKRTWHVVYERAHASHRQPT